MNYINAVVTFSISLYNKKKFDVNEFKIYTPYCTYFIIILRAICIYYYLLFNAIFGNISCLLWRDNLYLTYWNKTRNYTILYE